MRWTCVQSCCIHVVMCLIIVLCTLGYIFIGDLIFWYIVLMQKKVYLPPLLIVASTVLCIVHARNVFTVRANFMNAWWSILGVVLVGFIL